METIKVLIADDHLIYREGLKILLATTNETTVVGEAADGAEVVELATKLKPDVILMDIKMPQLNGLEATRQILSVLPDTGILMLTMLEDDHSIFTAMRAGARGYLLKGADHDEVLRAIKAAYHGEAIFGPQIAKKMMHFFARPAEKHVHNAALAELTEREMQVLQLIASGLSNPQIAEQLVISLKTVKNHISSIFTKLQVANRSQAIVRAREAGIGS